MRKSAVFCFVLLALVSLGLALVPKVSSQPENIKVLSYSWYVDSIDYFIVVGEVQNVGPDTIASVGLSGTVCTKDGAAHVSSYTVAFVQYLIPQQKAPFYMEFSPYASDTGDLSWLSLGVDRVDFSVNLAEATGDYQYPDLTVKSSSGKVDAEGVYWVIGTIQNSGTQTAKNIRVVGTFYNASGTMVGVGYTDPLTPTSLTPSSSASFKVGAFDLNQTVVPSIQKISSYSLLIQAERPILSGSAPSPSVSTTPSPTSTPSDNPQSSPEPSDSAPANSLAPETIYAIVVVIVILGLAGTLLMLRKRKSQAKSRTIKNRKSQMRKNRNNFFALKFNPRPQLESVVSDRVFSWVTG